MVISQLEYLKGFRKSEISTLLLRGVLVHHKTMHRYTVRAKQGGAQSANDSKNGMAHSAGAALRR